MKTIGKDDDRDRHRRQEARHPPLLLGRGQQARSSTCRTPTATRTSTSSASTSRSGNVRDFTPFQGVRAVVAGHRPEVPDEMLVVAEPARPQADRRLPPQPRDRRGGARHARTPATSSAGAPTRSFQVRAAQVDDARRRHRDPRPRRRQGAVEDAGSRAAPDEILDFLDFTPDGRSAYLTSSLGSDTARSSSATSRPARRKSSPHRRRSTSAASSIHPTKHVVAGGQLRARPHVAGRCSTRGRRRTSTASRKLHDGDFDVDQPRRGRRDLARRLHARPRPGPLLRLGPQGEEGHVPLRAPAEARGPGAGRDEAGHVSRRATA